MNISKWFVFALGFGGAIILTVVAAGIVNVVAAVVERGL